MMDSKRFLNLVPLLLAVCNFTSAVSAKNWPQWRGPQQNSVAAGKRFPVSWGEEQNILWKVAVPGWGTSTPAIWEDNIFLTGEDDGKNVLVCLNRSDGAKKWQTPLGQSAGNRNRKAGGANPSAITDGSHVFAYFRSGDLACLDFSGKIIWHTNVQEKHGGDGLNWDLGTSPVLTEQLVVLAVMHQAPSYLLALDKQTGAESWLQPREMGAPGESRDSYTTPLVIEQDGRQTIVVLGADFVTGHAAETGAEIWRFGSLNPGQRRNYRSIASPVATPEQIIVPYSRGNTLAAIRRGGAGDVTRSHQSWLRNEEVAADVPTPVVYNGRIYVCRDRGDVLCLDIRTGETVWSHRLPRNRYAYSASPVIAGGRLYATREDGTTFVLSLDGQPELVATNVLRENTYATPVFVDGKVYLRTSDFLFCIAER